MLTRTICVVSTLILLFATAASSADQNAIGAGNNRALEIARKSPLMESATKFLREEVAQIRDARLKRETLDALSNPETCIAHRAKLTAQDKNAIIAALTDAGLVDASAAHSIPGGLQAGIFPPVRDDGSSCPHLPQAFDAAPGSVFQGHHSYPGGLAMHEAFNDISALSLATDYRMAYGHVAANGLPTIDPNGDAAFAQAPGDLAIDQDLIIAAPIWHDWGKVLVFQWNADGTDGMDPAPLTKRPLGTTMVNSTIRTKQ